MGPSDGIYFALKRSNLQANPPTANTDFLAADYTVPKPGCRLTITIALDAANKFGIRITDSIGSSGVMYLNNNSALAASSVNTFTVGCRPGDTVNFQVDGSANVKIFSVEVSQGWI